MSTSPQSLAEVQAQLTGRHAIITGAAQGLGYAVALAYARAGMRLTLIDVQADRLADAHRTIAAETGQPDHCKVMAADLADAAATRQAAADARSAFGTPRVIVHNAAILNRRLFADMDMAEWSRVINVALGAAYILTHTFWSAMAESGAGSVIYVSSRSGIEGFMEESAYCASKHALEGLMKTLAMEGKPLGIAVNTVTPGMYMRTPMSERNYTDDLKQKWVDPILLTPAFVLLAAQGADGITGERVNAWELSQRLTATA
jgi:NAD(P)-dependent dehydrogenase (short-subunit alcohol dehydrogenase family)